MTHRSNPIVHPGNRKILVLLERAMAPIIVKAKPALILIVLIQIFGVGLSQAQSANMIGNWRVEITFANGENRSLRFQAREFGKGSFLPLIPRPDQIDPTGLAAAKWTQSDESSVLFSGPVEFPLGNVGRAAGTLVLTGKFGTDRRITGEAKFFPLDQDPKDPKARPSKSGNFQAVRITGD